MKLDYKKLGFKSGLEIHAQLNSHKLFCECPSILRKDKPDVIVKRELRPLAGEVGKIDPAAIFEKKKRKYYIYEAYSDTTCLVELDEEPPHIVNEEALDIALLVAKMMHCEIPSQVQVMRKTVVDGSNTSGFQRTILIGLNGWVQVKNKKIGINYIILEEDAARKIAEDSKSVTFRLDRLGIPMLEIVTAPDMRTPEEVRDAAETIGMLLRSTGKMKRGIGTIRQDVNISIKGHRRVEMKGVQDLRLMTKYIEKEVARQIKTKGKEEQHVRTVKEDFTSKYLRPLPGAARMYPETDIPLIPIPRSRIKALKIPETLEAKEERFTKLSLSKDLARTMSRWKNVKLFESLIQKFKKVKPNIIASTLLSIPGEVKRKTDKAFTPTDEQYSIIFALLDKDKIVKEALLDIFIQLSKGRSIEDITVHYEKLTDKELKAEIKKIKQENPKATEGKLIGIAMSKLRTCADPKKIIELVKRK